MARITTDRIRAITPSSLLGIDRKMATADSRSRRAICPINSRDTIVQSKEGLVLPRELSNFITTPKFTRLKGSLPLTFIIEYFKACEIK